MEKKETSEERYAVAQGKEIEKELCEGCGEMVSLDDMSGVMEMYICNECEDAINGDKNV